MQGTAGWAKGPVYVLSEESEIDALPPMETALVVAQTTFPPAKWERLTAYLARKIPGVKLRPTICSATQIRQTEAEELARRPTRMIGGRRQAQRQYPQAVRYVQKAVRKNHFGRARGGNTAWLCKYIFRFHRNNRWRVYAGWVT